ncbi:hypothetical protein AB0952_01510 [Streptomyces caniferus]|uniref:hypothetical protein n=1 Tax=Streptomyces caniferus TaxID=285557 RepID=UPI0034557C7A
MDSATASLTVSLPAGTIVEPECRNVSFRVVPGQACPLPPDRATTAPSTRSGRLPNRFDSLIRTRDPPTLIRTT